MTRIARVQPEGLFINPAYTHVVSSTGTRTVYIAGQVAVDSTGEVVGPGDHTAQTVQVMKNLQTALEAVGADFRDVVKITTYVVGLTPEVRFAVGVARATFFGKEPPASTLVGVPALALPEWLVEIEAIASLD